MAGGLRISGDFRVPHSAIVWRGGMFRCPIHPFFSDEWDSRTLTCHPERSAAEPRDLQFAAVPLIPTHRMSRTPVFTLRVPHSAIHLAGWGFSGAFTYQPPELRDAHTTVIHVTEPYSGERDAQDGRALYQGPASAGPQPATKNRASAPEVGAAKRDEVNRAFEVVTLEPCCHSTRLLDYRKRGL